MATSDPKPWETNEANNIKQSEKNRLAKYPAHAGFSTGLLEVDSVKQVPYIPRRSEEDDAPDHFPQAISEASGCYT